MRNFALSLIFATLPLFIGAQEKPDVGASLQKGNGRSQLQANSNDKTDSNKKFIMSSGQTLGVPGNADRLVGSMYFLCGNW
jgi:hypothetical protein